MEEAKGNAAIFPSRAVCLWLIVFFPPLVLWNGDDTLPRPSCPSSDKRHWGGTTYPLVCLSGCLTPKGWRVCLPINNLASPSYPRQFPIFVVSFTGFLNSLFRLISRAYLLLPSRFHMISFPLPLLLLAHFKSLPSPRLLQRGERCGSASGGASQCFLPSVVDGGGSVG